MRDDALDKDVYQDTKMNAGMFRFLGPKRNYFLCPVIDCPVQGDGNTGVEGVGVGTSTEKNLYEIYQDTTLLFRFCREDEKKQPLPQQKPHTFTILHSSGNQEECQFID